MVTCPEAVYDCLAICEELGAIAGGAGEIEIACFAYLGCLLAVYDGAPPSDWGYQFSSTHTFAPFSYSLTEAMDSLKAANLIVNGDNGLLPTSEGRMELDRLRWLHRFRERGKFLEASCRSATAMPLPVVTEVLAAEPSLRRAIELDSSRVLLDQIGRHAVMEHFAVLRRAVPAAVDLFVPAVVWLTYLSRQFEADRLAAQGREVA